MAQVRPHILPQRLLGSPILELRWAGYTRVVRTLCGSVQQGEGGGKKDEKDKTREGLLLEAKWLRSPCPPRPRPSCVTLGKRAKTGLATGRSLEGPPRPYAWHDRDTGP